MLNNEEVNFNQAGCAWEDCETRIEVFVRDKYGYGPRFADVFLYPNHPHSRSKITLTLSISEYEHGAKVEFQDLLGNGGDSSYQDRGYGTTLVRISVRVLERTLSHLDAHNIKVVGCLAPHNSDDASSHSRRRHFWNRLGFNIAEPDNQRSPMSGTLQGMIDALPDEEFPGIDSFWPVDSQPIIQPGDSEYLKSLDLATHPEPSNPSCEELDIALKRDTEIRTLIAGFVIAGIVIGALINFYESNPAIALLLALFSPVVAGFCSKMLIANIPFLNEHDLLSQKRSAAIRASKSLKRTMEDERPGINNRISQALSAIKVHPSHLDEAAFLHHEFVRCAKAHLL